MAPPRPVAGDAFARPGSGREIDLALAAGLALATGLLFLGVLGNGFVNYDDPGYVTANPEVRGGLTLHGLRWAFTSFAESNWHPLTWLSHMADVQLFGLEPAGHHATSVVLHALCAACLFLALRGMTSRRWPSLFVAALFAWHPTRVESVAWISERKDVLSGLLLVLVVWAHAAAARRPGLARRALVVVLLALGLAAKPMLVTAPFLLLLLDWWPLRRRPGTSWKRLVVEKLPLFALVAASAWITVRAQGAGGAIVAADRLPLSDRLGGALLSLAGYLKLLVWPVGLALPYPPRGSLDAGALLGAGTLLAALSSFAWRLRRRAPAMLVGWCWFLGSLVPVIGLVQVGVQPMADRYTYLPFIGLGLALAFGVDALWWSPSRTRDRKGWPGVVLVAGLLACLPLTLRRVSDWHDSERLFAATLAVTEHNAVAEHQYGRALYDRGDPQAAGDHFAAALAIQPGYADALVSLGAVRLEQGDHEAAMELWRRALARAPGHLLAAANLAAGLVAEGQVQEGLERLEALAAQAPGDAFVQNSLGVARARAGQVEQSLGPLRRSLELDPHNALAWRNLGLSLDQLGRTREAEEALRACLVRDDRDAVAHFLLAGLLARSGREPAARAEYAVALRLDPDFDAAREALAALAGGAERDAEGGER